MKYSMTVPCDACPFLNTPQTRHGFSISRLKEFASGEFPCHKTAEYREGDDGNEGFHASDKSVHCAGALIFNEKRNTPNQMMRICERLGFYDARTLDMKANVR